MTSSAVYKKKDIKDRLLALYSEEEATKSEVLITKLIVSYRDKIRSKPYKMTQEDVILITYGDQVIEPSVEPLQTLGKFLDRHIKGVINTVHILPFYPYSSDDGFSVIDYKDVSPRIGSWDDIEALSENYNLMFDGVINHISQYSYWFKSFLENNPKYANFFVEVDPSVDLSMVVRPRALPLLHEYKDIDEKSRFVWTTFSKDQVDLNYANSAVMIAVLDVLLFYVEKGAKLIRLDAIAFLWKELGTDCIHLPQTHEAIQLMREVIHKVAPEVVIITETNVPHDENISYFGSGDDEAQMVYNFALPPLAAHTILSGDTTALIAWAKSLTLPSDKVCFFNFIASHDGCGLRPVADLLSESELGRIIENVEINGGHVSYRGTSDGGKAPYELNASFIDIISPESDDLELRAKKFMLIQAMKLAMPGVPGVYFHSLVGSTSDKDGVRRSGVLRSINREKLNYDILKDELAEEGSLRALIFEEYKHLLSLRKKENAFDPYGDFEVLDLEEGLFSLLRLSKDSKFNILSINNFTNQPICFQLPSFVREDAIELLRNKIILNSDIEIKAYQTMWIRYPKEI
ncbi:MAG TPA: sugar phosphorylase [Campylobacterales bacterium]|nr:sugar phosphorylase [Campylobacterales bacterium]